jgi:hypothetical protein
MTTYATYSYYTATFLGTAIASTDFSRLALRASAIIDQLTFNRASVIVTAATDTATIDLIKMATCEVAEAMQAVETGGADGITSESIGSYSVSYGAGSIKSLPAIDKYMQAARLWLGNTELLFRGFATDEYGTNVDTA